MSNKHKFSIHEFYKAMQEVISLNFDWDSHEDLNKVHWTINMLEEFNEDPDKFLDSYRELNNNGT